MMLFPFFTSCLMCFYNEAPEKGQFVIPEARFSDKAYLTAIGAYSVERGSGKLAPVRRLVATKYLHV